MNKVFIFSLVHFIFFALMLSIFRPLPGVDVLENYFWGRHFELGYYKHPPLFAWVQELVGMVFGYTVTSSYITSYFFIFITFISVFFLAKEFTTENKAFISVLLLETLSFSGITARTFNANLAQIPFWVLAPLFYIYGIKTKKVINFALFGFFLGLGFLAKYFTLLLGLVIFISFVSNRQTLSLLKTPLPYIAVFAFFITVSPHIYWLIQHNFEPLNYIASEQKRGLGFWEVRFKYSFSYIILSILTILPIVISFFILFKDFKFRGINFQNPKENLLFCISVLPFAITSVVSSLLGMFVLIKWSATFFFVLPVFIFYFWDFKERVNFKNKLKTLIAFFFLLWGVIVIIQGMNDKKDKHQFFKDIEEIAKIHTEKWENKTGKKLKFVSGNTLNAGAFAFFSDAKPDVIPDGNLKFAPYINLEELKKEGCIEILECDENLCDISKNQIQEVRKTYFKRSKVFYLVIVYKDIS